MDKQKELTDLLLKKAKDGRITCTEARQLAEELQVPPATVGKTCDELKIRIKACELGCF